MRRRRRQSTGGSPQITTSWATPRRSSAAISGCRSSSGARAGWAGTRATGAAPRAGRRLWRGGDNAARRSQKRHGRRPKNLLGETLYRVSIAEGLAWAGSRADVEVLAARPRYLPDVARHLLAVPGLGEVATWNLLLILRRRDDSTLRPAPGGDS